jgi:CheY-like chemotaxis protein
MLAPSHILVVEDEVLLQMVAVDYLEEAGFRSETAGSATEAINMLAAINGDVRAAIIDVGLPDRSGDVLVAEIRAINPLLPIVIASGYADQALRNRFKPDGRVAFLNKPYNADQLRSALASLKVAAE